MWEFPAEVDVIEVSPGELSVCSNLHENVRDSGTKRYAVYRLAEIHEAWKELNTRQVYPMKEDEK